MQDIGYLTFGNDKAKNTFLSLTKKERKEFQDDFFELLKKLNNEMIKQNIYQGVSTINQRLNNRYFRIELAVDMTPNKPQMVLLETFKEFFNVDDYLDSINENKNLKVKGFRGIEINCK